MLVCLRYISPIIHAEVTQMLLHSAMQSRLRTDLAAVVMGSRRWIAENPVDSLRIFVKVKGHLALLV